MENPEPNQKCRFKCFLHWETKCAKLMCLTLSRMGP
jgi:hypothetical protein